MIIIQLIHSERGTFGHCLGFISAVDLNRIGTKVSSAYLKKVAPRGRSAGLPKVSYCGRSTVRAESRINCGLIVDALH
jgi:hypothetical protein